MNRNEKLSREALPLISRAELSCLGLYQQPLPRHQKPKRPPVGSGFGYHCRISSLAKLCLVHFRWCFLEVPNPFSTLLKVRGGMAVLGEICFASVVETSALMSVAVICVSILFFGL